MIRNDRSSFPFYCACPVARRSGSQHIGCHTARAALKYCQSVEPMPKGICKLRPGKGCHPSKRNHMGMPHDESCPFPI